MAHTKLKAALFDIGSTLVTGPALSPSKVILKILANPDLNSSQIGRILMREEFKDAVAVCERFRSLGYNLSPVHEEQVIALWQRQEWEAKQIDGAIEVVKTLKKRGCKIGLISDIWVPYYRSFEKSCPEITALTDSFILSFKEGIKKPDIALYERALVSLNSQPSETIMIGDTYFNDIEPAITLGMSTVWVLNRPDREIEALIHVLNRKKPKPDYTITHIKELANLPFWED